MTRKVVQITTAFDAGDGSTASGGSSYQPAIEVVALCDDGSMWHMAMLGSGQWHRLPDVPQPDEPRQDNADFSEESVEAAINAWFDDANFFDFKEEPVLNRKNRMRAALKAAGARP